MNIAKNMEAIFVAALILAGAASYANAAVTARTQTAKPVAATVKITEIDGLQTVTITAKRLTPAKTAADGV